MLRCFLKKSSILKKCTRSNLCISRGCATAAASTAVPRMDGSVAGGVTSSLSGTDASPSRVRMTAAEELEAISTNSRKELSSPDPKAERHRNVALRIIDMVSQHYKQDGKTLEWVTAKRRDQLVAHKMKRNVPDADTTNTVEDAEAALNGSNKFHHTLINLFSAYIRYECELEELLESTMLPQRLRAKRWQQRINAYRLDSLEKQYVLHPVCNAVENKDVSLVVAARLLRRRWPSAVMDGNVAAHHRFISKSVFAWIAEKLQNDTLSPLDARAVLDNCAFALKRDGSVLVGKVAMVAIRDIREKDNPEALITLMWSVSSSGVHAPDNFWRQIFLRLVEINHLLKGCGDLPVPNKDAEAASSSGKSNTTSQGTHVFSGLTTRQIYRILALLKKEKWSGEAGDMHELADQALKNIVFEAEALTLSEGESSSEVSKTVLVKRLRALSDLSFQEFLSLITIAGDLGVPFHISALRISDILFVPLTRFLDQHQLLSLLLVVRQTRCYAPSLITTISNQLQKRGSHAPYALPLAKAFIRAVIKEKSLLLLPAVIDFMQYFLTMCEELTEKVRLSELSTLADLVYGLYRSHAPDSVIGMRTKVIIDEYCRQADRLMQLQLVSTAVPSKLLELTIVMGMRDSPQQYRNVKSLLQTRNASVAESKLYEDVALLAKQREETSLSSSCDESLSEKGGGTSIIAKWSALEEDHLPAIPKAALHVYNELLYFFEKIVVVRSDVTSVDMEKFRSTIEQTGLFNIFLGAYLMQQGHLSPSASCGKLSKDAGNAAGSQLPAPIQRRVHKHIMIKLHRVRQAPSKKFTEDELLHILGQVHCNPKKINKLLNLINKSPLLLTKQQRDVWIYISKLVECFGDASQKKQVEEKLRSSFF